MHTPMGYRGLLAYCSPLSGHRGAAGALLAPRGFAAFLRARWSCLLHLTLDLGGLGGAPSLQTSTGVWAVVRGPCVLKGDEKDKAGAEVVGNHLLVSLQCCFLKIGKSCLFLAVICV